MTRITYLLAFCVLTLILTVVNADVKWWQTGTPFKRNSSPFRPTRAIPSSDIPRTCHCTKPQHCLDNYFDPITKDSGCEVDNELCCKNLRLGAQNSNERNAGIEELIDEGSPSFPNQVIELATLEKSTRNKRERWACGKPHFQLNPKVNEMNYNAQVGEFPWTLAILEKIDSTGKPLIRCGASLISQKLALTAAHCITNLEKDKIIVRAGEWDLNNEEEMDPHQDRRVVRISIHEDYDPVNMDNDIALMLLDKGFVESQNIGLICLAKESKIKAPCFSSGWGQRKTTISPEDQSIMKKVELYLTSFNLCQKKFRKLDPRFNLTDSSVCASKLPKGIDTGYGDGGNPLFCKRSDDRFVLVGIASWGKVAYRNMPGVYTSIRKLRSWIDRQSMEIVPM